MVVGLVAGRCSSEGIEVCASATCAGLELVQGGFQRGVEFYGVAFLAQALVACAFGGRVEIVVFRSCGWAAAVKYGSALRTFGCGTAYCVLRLTYAGAACYQQQCEAYVSLKGGLHCCYGCWIQKYKKEVKRVAYRVRVAVATLVVEQC